MSSEMYSSDEVGDVYRVPDTAHPYEWVYVNRRSCQRASGVYVIRNRETGRVYVGSSLNLRLRFTQHRSDLNNRNGRGQLQADWAEYGEQRFMFIVLERIDNPVRGQLAQAEQVWLTYYGQLLSVPRPYNARLWVWRSDDGAMERYRLTRPAPQPKDT